MKIFTFADLPSENACFRKGKSSLFFLAIFNLKIDPLQYPKIIKSFKKALIMLVAFKHTG